MLHAALDASGRVYLHSCYDASVVSIVRCALSYSA